jgi:antitoxin component of MazEF toxin-antitoxin module
MKLLKIGNGYGVVVPAKVLELTCWQPGDQLEAELDGKELKIRGRDEHTVGLTARYDRRKQY